MRALGFVTPLFGSIGAETITEIIIDSTFKTNQERFELFAVNANCGGYGMPIAYLLYISLTMAQKKFDPIPKIQPKPKLRGTTEFFRQSSTRRT